MGLPLKNADKSAPLYDASVQSDKSTYRQTLIKMQLCSPRLFFLGTALPKVPYTTQMSLTEHVIK